MRQSRRSKLIQVVHTGTTNNGKSMIVVIPREVRDMLSLEKGRPLAVSIEGKGRIIYDILEAIPQ